ncbi:MAG TPA: zinc ribbon domain-containing protein, partial [Gemmatimonadales bacterium]|nr:zinc ribbon domain-containing protein [Gemmatimonadales bacterium]
MTRSLAAKPSPRSAGCPFCEHVNTATARFCNACGAPMHLVPCARCGAVNDPKAAATCYQCDAALPETRLGDFARSSSGAEMSAAAGSPAWTIADRAQPIEQPLPDPDGLDPDAKLLATLQELERQLVSSDSGAVADRLAGESAATPGANPDSRTAVAPLTRIRSDAASAIAGSPSIQAAPRVISRRALAVIVGAGVLAVLAAAGEYYTYQQRVARTGSQAPASDAMKEGDHSAATAFPVNPANSTPALAATPPSASSTPPTAPAPDGSAAAMRPGSTPPAEARSATTPPVARSSGEALGSPRRAAAEAKAAAEPAGERPRAAGVAPGVIEQPPRVGPCTEAVAALGLCT